MARRKTTERKEAPSVAPYPAHWEADVALRDGTTAHLRPITPSDAQALQRFHRAQSPQSIYFRFFAPMAELSPGDLERFTNVDHTDRVAIIVVRREEIIGVGRFDRLEDGRTAEVAFNVSDHHHGQGIGSVLLDHLAAAARERQITRFVADVLPGNSRMISVFAEAGYEVKKRYDDGVIAVSFNIDPTDRSVAVMADREHRAEARSLQGLLGARSVMVVGAGRDDSSLGHRVLRNIVVSGFTGAVHAVNPEAFEVQGVLSYARIEEVPAPVDLAVIAVPAAAVPQVVEKCGEQGVRAVLVISAGFAETGPEGLARQRELVRIAREYGMRLVGPNSFGLLNTGSDQRLNASLAPYLPVRGGLGLFCQSGAMAVSLLASVDRRGIGISSFLSAGNRADVSGNDMMQFLDEDDATSVVALYLESIGNPRKFSRIARRLSRRKPVIVVKSGLAGYVVPPGHAVRATRSPRETLHEMFRQAGVIRADNVHQLLDFSQVLMHQPLPAGNRMAVVSNSDSLSAVITDAGAAWGLSIARPATSLHAQASAEEFAVALDDVFNDPRVDVVVASFVPPVGVLDSDVARNLAQAAARAGKTTVACFLGMRGVAEVLTADDAHGVSRTVPAYVSPEDAVLSLAAAVRYSQWRATDDGQRVDPPGIDANRGRELVANLLIDAEPGQRVELSESQAAEVLGAYG
ncbi:MAG TPA: GNAT family N-acetyltransferase, partial [Actinomycetales bacterium]|nr:GNAT family N-acetyltransferase [Actinomycetales bacterium]